MGSSRVGKGGSVSAQPANCANCSSPLPRGARFCAACGTPLSYRHPDGPIIELLTGAFDSPQRVPPTYATGTESALPWLAHLVALPGRATLETTGAEKLLGLAVYQHPDHDTDAGWKPPQ